MSRLVMNHLQYEFGLVPVKIVKEDKAEYIQALVDARDQDSLEPFRAFMFEEHIRNIRGEIDAFRRSQDSDPIKATSDPIKATSDPIKVTSDPIKATSDPIKQKLLQAILQDNSLNYAAYGAIVGVSEATVKRRLNEMKRDGQLLRIGSNKTGHWEVI